MTLDTRVYVLGQVDYRALFVKCNQLIGAHEGIRFEDGPERWPTGDDSQPKPGNPSMIWNKPGQGLCALMDVKYRPDAPLVSPERSAEHDDDCADYEGDCTAYHPRACWLEVSFDTTYGYRGDNGESCGDLHARLVFELGQWLDSRGLRWQWTNEFTGETHWGYEGLNDLGNAGSEAGAWFRTTAAPAIAAHIALESGGAA